MSRNYQVALGDFRFLLNQAAYDELTLTTRYRWARQDVIQAHPHYQSLGMGEQTLTLKGAMFNVQTGRPDVDQMQRLRAIAQNRKPMRLALENGFNMGYWVILSIEETQQHLIVSAPLKQAFNIQLAYYGEKA